MIETLRSTRNLPLTTTDTAIFKTFGKRVEGGYSHADRSAAETMLARVDAKDEPTEPTQDQQTGMNWWNSLTPTARTFWLEQASVPSNRWNASPADAWEVYKHSVGVRKPPP